MYSRVTRHVNLLLNTNRKESFLWVSCQLDQLAKVSTPRQVRAALNSSPIGLYSTYSRILQSIPLESRPIASKTLRALAHAIEPLTLDVLTEVIAIEEDCTSLSGLDKLIEPTEIFNICGSLIRLSEVDGTIGLSHKSVYEYLTQERDPTQLPKEFYLPKRESSALLAQVCLKYLSFQDFSESEIQGPTSEPRLDASISPGEHSISRLTKSPFFDYALKHWWEHLASVEKEFQEVSSELSRFTDPVSGNFFSCLTILGSIYGPYRYPASMQLVHFSASHGLSTVLHNLLTEPPDLVNLQTDGGRAPLHMAIEQNQQKSVQVLLAHKADANLCASNGTCPLQIALESRNEAITQTLVEGQADVNAQFSSGDTPLIVAVANSWHWLIHFL